MDQLDGERVENERAKTAFVSWAHEDDEREQQVGRLAGALRISGIDADVDLYHLDEPDIDWTRWGPARIEEVDYVLIVASKPFKERWQGSNAPNVGAGAVHEADALHGLFERDQSEFQRRVKIVLLPDVAREEIPDDLRRLKRFDLAGLDREHMEELIRMMTDQPRYIPPPLGVIPLLPPIYSGHQIAQPGVSVAQLLVQRDELRDKLAGAEGELRQLPPPDVTDGPHLPWVRRRALLEGQVAGLRGTLQPLDALIAEYGQESHDLLRDANVLAERQVLAEEAAIAPVLRVRRNGRNTDGATSVESVFIVENLGKGAARQVIVETTWGEAPASLDVLAPGETTQARVAIPYQDWVRGSDPERLAVRYLDQLGNELREEAIVFRVSWEDGTQIFKSRLEAINAARSMSGVVLVHREPSGSVTTFRDGRELDDAEATEATLEFRDRHKA